MIRRLCSVLPMMATTCVVSGALAAAAEPPEPAQEAVIVSIEYLCDGGKRVLTTRGGDEPVRTPLSVKDEPALQDLEMRDVLATSGLKVSNGAVVWWTRGNEGVLAQEDPPQGSGEILIDGCKDIDATR